MELEPAIARDRIGVDFVIAEECGTWDECQGYVDVYGDHLVAIEYVPEDLADTCARFGDRLSVVLRDVDAASRIRRTAGTHTALERGRPAERRPGRSRTGCAL